MGTEIEFHYIAILQHSIVTCVGRVVRRDMIQRATGRKRNAGFESVFLHEFTVHVLDLIAHVDQFDAWLNDALRKLADLRRIAKCEPFVLDLKLRIPDDELRPRDGCHCRCQ